MKLRLNDYSQSEAIKIIREWSGMTQTAFARSIGKTLQTVQRYESGEINYSMHTFYQIMKTHGLAVTVEKKR